MNFFKLILRNTLRHKLRTGLTVTGLVVAILAFGLLQTVVDAWYAGAESAAPNRLITRNAISLTFPHAAALPREDPAASTGCARSARRTGSAASTRTRRTSFRSSRSMRCPISQMYPEYRIAEDELRAFLRDRKGAVVGRKLAQTHGFKIGDTIPLQGTIYAGTWPFTVRAIYDGAEAKTDTSQMFFHWDYVNETVKAKLPRRGDQVGVFVVQIEDAGRSAEIAQAIDRQFANSLAETLTETEKAFQLGFVAMTEAIVVAIRIVSFVVIFIILAVMANTMAMTARERLAEYATLKVLGFGPGYVARLIFGESIALALIGAAIGIALTFPVGAWFAAQVGTLFPVFEVSTGTVALQAACAIVVGIAAALAPGHRAARVKIVDGLRAIG